MMIRAAALRHNDSGSRCVLWETHPDDGGKIWVPPVRTPLWGFPPHLLRVPDGRILCSYGYRKPPFGERACLSDDGITWDLSNEVILRDDAPNGDRGDPASVEQDSTREALYSGDDLDSAAGERTLRTAVKNRIYSTVQ